MIHFIIDCDGVLLDWVTGFRQFMWDRHRHYIQTKAPDDYDMVKWIGVGSSKVHGLLSDFNGCTSFADLKPCEGAVQAVRELSALGSLRVLSSCGDRPAVRVMRAKNLWAQFSIPSDQITCLPLGQSKFDFMWETTRNRDPRKVVLIEDSFDQAQAGVAHGARTYCIRRPWNRQEEASNPDTSVIWVDRLREIVLAFHPSNQLNVD